jgi:hypothetical protein
LVERARIKAEEIRLAEITRIKVEENRLAEIIRKQAEDARLAEQTRKQAETIRLAEIARKQAAEKQATERQIAENIRLMALEKANSLKFSPMQHYIDGNMSKVPGYKNTRSPTPFFSGCGSSYSYVKLPNGFDLVGRTSHPKGMLNLMAVGGGDTYASRVQRCNQWLLEYPHVNMSLISFRKIDNVYSGKPIYALKMSFNGGPIKTIASSLDCIAGSPTPLGILYAYTPFCLLDPAYCYPGGLYYHKYHDGSQAQFIPCLDDAWISELAMYYTNYPCLTTGEELAPSVSQLIK